MSWAAEKERWQVQGRRVRMARSGAGLTQGELADEIGKRRPRTFTREVVSRIEKGERDAEIGVLAAIAEITGQPLIWLIGADELIPVGVSVNPGELKRRAAIALLDPKRRVLADSTVLPAAA